VLFTRRQFTRRSLLRSTPGAALALGAMTARSSASRAQASPTQLITREIAPGIFVSEGRHELFTPANAGHISNVSFVIGNESVAVIDTGGSAGVGRALLASIRSITDRPIRYVINTHMHPDHVFGNGPLAALNPVFVGHAKLPRSLAARGERYLAVNVADLGPEAFDGTRIIAPTQLVETTATLDLGNRILTLTAHKTAHTDNDLTVRDDITETVFLGDLLFSAHVPTIDGSIKGWIETMKTLGKTPAARVVPGHGPASMPWPEAMAAELRYLETIASDVRAMIKQGRTLSEAARTAGQSEKAEWLLFDFFHARNVSTAFAELEWE
jgi:quinoprotein relay system zinc metallohydrolase 2